jgi:Family of unknown function (DUF5755)
MKKKCPPGVICIENITMWFLVLAILFLIYFIFCIYKSNNSVNSANVINKHDVPLKDRSYEIQVIQQAPNFPFNNLTASSVPKDVLLNPYSPPLRDERYLSPQINLVPPGTIPINISTNVGAVDTNYRQVGILNPSNKPNKDNVLPLMGRPVFTNRDKWQYYTIGNQHNNIKLPIIVKGRSGLNEYGVDRLYNGDTIYLEGLNDVYRVTIYDNDTIKYLPFI